MVKIEKLRCITCGSFIEIGKGAVKFPCPICGEIIARCARCRTLARRYKHECGFEGP